MKDKITKKRIYCRECGTKLENHFTKMFNEYTGKQEIDTHCPNLKCEKGCNFVGHVWNHFGTGNTCKRCGLKVCDYF